MGITTNELFDSRIVSITSSGFTEKRVYHIKGQQDPTEYAALLQQEIGTAHPVYAETILLQISIRPESADELLVAEYSYGPREGSGGKNGNKNNEAWQWEMTGQSAHINSVELKDTDPTNLHTYQTMYNNAAVGGGAADTIAIGIDGDNATGTDVFRPYGSIKVSKTFAAAEVTQELRKKLYLMQNRTNKEAWLSDEFAPEEVLFLGANIKYD